MLEHGDLNRRLSRFGGRPSAVYVFEASVNAAQGAAQAAAAAGDAAAAAGEAKAQALPPLQQQSQQQARQLRVPFAANKDATVALTVIDLQLDGSS